MTKWEYCEVTVAQRDMTGKLNEMGNLGWEYVTDHMAELASTREWGVRKRRIIFRKPRN